MTKNILPFENQKKKMQLDVDIEPTLRFPGMTSIEKEMDQSESKLLVYQVQLSQLSQGSMKSESPILTDSCGCIMMLLGHTHLEPCLRELYIMKLSL